MNWQRAGKKIRIIIDWENESHSNIVGCNFSYRGLKSLIPGTWLNDEILHIMINRIKDETGNNPSILTMDTQFAAKLTWDSQR